MISIVLFLLCGLGTGFLLRNRKGIHTVAEKTASLVVFLLLFLLGLGLSGNKEALGQMAGVGVKAALLAVAGVAGSVVASAPVYTRFFKPILEEERTER